MTDTRRPPAPLTVPRRTAARQATLLAHAKCGTPASWSAWLTGYMTTLAGGRMTDRDVRESLRGLADAMQDIALTAPTAPTAPTQGWHR